MTPRRFPQPWTVEDHNDACIIVKDRNGYALAYVYYQEELGPAIDPRRGAPHCGEHCQAARLTGPAAVLRA